MFADLSGVVSAGFDAGVGGARGTELDMSGDWGWLEFWGIRMMALVPDGLVFKDWSICGRVVSAIRQLVLVSRNSWSKVPVAMQYECDDGD